MDAALWGRATAGQQGNTANSAVLITGQ